MSHTVKRKEEHDDIDMPQNRFDPLEIEGVFLVTSGEVVIGNVGNDGLMRCWRELLRCGMDQIAGSILIHSGIGERVSDNCVQCVQGHKKLLRHCV
jgi:hypothetical protein